MYRCRWMWRILCTCEGTQPGRIWATIVALVCRLLDVYLSGFKRQRTHVGRGRTWQVTAVQCGTNRQLGPARLFRPWSLSRGANKPITRCHSLPYVLFMATAISVSGQRQKCSLVRRSVATRQHTSPSVIEIAAGSVGKGSVGVTSDFAVDDPDWHLIEFIASCTSFTHARSYKPHNKRADDNINNC